MRPEARSVTVAASSGLQAAGHHISPQICRHASSFLEVGGRIHSKTTAHDEAWKLGADVSTNDGPRLILGAAETTFAPAISAISASRKRVLAAHGLSRVEHDAVAGLLLCSRTSQAEQDVVDVIADGVGVDLVDAAADGLQALEVPGGVDDRLEGAQGNGLIVDWDHIRSACSQGA